MQAIGIKKNDIVIMPSINFIASYNVAKNFRAKIYLADIDPLTGQMSPEKVEECCLKFKIKKVKAIIVMYNAGYPENADKFFRLKKNLSHSLLKMLVMPLELNIN